MKRALIIAAFVVVAIALAPSPHRTRVASACAFDTPPTTYETTEDRKIYMQAMDLAGFDMLFPKDPFFSQPSMEQGTRASRTTAPQTYVPPTLLKAIAWIESDMSMGAAALPFGAIGPDLVSFDCGYGVAQVTSGMTTPIGANGQPADQQALVATHFAYNIGRGAAILIDKWNAAPSDRPIVGIDTNSDPHIVENWYYAIWSYNGFTGPGANRSNHPMDPVYGAWPRTPYSCGPSNDGFSHNRSLFPYQELVYGCAAHPPTVLGQPLWNALPSTLPDLKNPYWSGPLDLKNFQAPYTKMDLPTPKPQHTDPTPKPDASVRLAILGQPKLSVDRPMVLVTIRAGQSATPAQVRISNIGTGIVPWKVVIDKAWVKPSLQAGVAVGSDLPCNPGSPCDRTAVLNISVDATKLLGSDSAWIHIVGLIPGVGTQDIAVIVRASVAIGIPGTTRN